MSLRYQDPEAADPAYLLEALITTAREAHGGGALFAFASRDGVRILLDDPDFRAFLDRAPFDLVVGVDSVTDEAAIDELIRSAGEATGLTARAFLHDRRTIFHPKLCWFQTTAGGKVFVGSGNLTVGGLAGNWEAYAELTLTPADLADHTASWLAWADRHAPRLFPIDDPAVRTRAARNLRVARPRPAPVERRPEEPAARAPLPEIAAVLLAEIPRAADRWKQANFDLNTFRNFFGADPAISQRIFLWRLRRDGTVDGVEVRPTVSVRSRNYRVELDAASGLDYPTGDDRPIGAFLRVSVRQFRYILVMPGDPDYATAADLLTSGAGPRLEARMRRHVFDPAEVEARWPLCPLLLTEDEPAEPDEAPPEE